MSEVRERLKILVVEDDLDLATTCARLLLRMGHAPRIAQSGLEAMALIEEEPPDLILTDLRLPAADGLAVVRHARRSAQNIPVILFTAYASQASRREALEAGAAVYLAKPFSAAQLRCAIERALLPASQGPRAEA